MFKNKTIKLFLILGVILFSLVGVVGCSNPTVSDNVNATYIRIHFEDSKLSICIFLAEINYEEYP